MLSDKFAGEIACEALLDNEPLSLDDVEGFAKGASMSTSESGFNYTFAEANFIANGNLKFDDFKKDCLDKGELHQLQYDAYKEI